MARCNGITKAGNRCKAMALEGSDYCIQHQSQAVLYEDDPPPVPKPPKDEEWCVVRVSDDQTVILNGKRFDLPANRDYPVPPAVVDILAESGYEFEVVKEAGEE